MTSAIIQKLIERGQRLAEADDRQASERLWRRAVERGGADAVCELGAGYYGQSKTAGSLDRQKHGLVCATLALRVVAAAEYRLPRASFLLGQMAEDLAGKVACNVTLAPEIRATLAGAGLKSAAGYFYQSAMMEGAADAETRAAAMLKLADYHRIGTGGCEKSDDVAARWVQCALDLQPCLDSLYRLDSPARPSAGGAIAPDRRLH